MQISLSAKQKSSSCLTFICQRMLLLSVVTYYLSPCVPPREYTIPTDSVNKKHYKFSIKLNLFLIFFCVEKAENIFIAFSVVSKYISVEYLSSLK